MPNLHYTPIIGLEIHAELKTQSKMFCGCANNPFLAKKPNIHTCPVCLGMPGGLPVPNKKAIEWIIRLGLALNCQVNQFSKFDRKNYFYPDLAKGYQISQHDIPFCHDGVLETSQGIVRIRRIHLEEDTAKLLHETVHGEPVSLIDFNRSGVPLVEIVTEPDIINGQQAQEYGKKIRQIIRFLGIGDCKMAEGGMRLEANVSLRSPSDKALPNYKVEVKNINSFKFLEQAINFEIERQTQLLDQGQQPVQETRGWDSKKNCTFSQRTKEDAADYRYFPEPDIPPIVISDQQLKQLQTDLPELPTQISHRWQDQFQIPEQTASILITDAGETTVIDQLFLTAKQQQLSPSQLANDLVNKKIPLLVNKSQSQQDLSNTIRQILVQFKKLHQTQKIDNAQLEEIVRATLATNQDAVAKYQAGKTQVLGFLLGQIRAQTAKDADMNQIRQTLIQALQK
ncbi:MAG TPA: Asp-tRNA(Asn)/Glu-tRNA(Gln) amidotransferase subunit GatB [Candidatus Woesebacteria bacterium]|nr:Asp-tRNA(Asn)/Glu-tRNA(Gln) amidotransferase subunit GatB [Candidatus Woesebacteria bacterium]